MLKGLRNSAGLGRSTHALLVMSMALLAAGCDAEETSTTFQGEGAASDVMVVMNKPNNLHVVDLGQRRVIRTCELPGDFGPGTVAVAPDGNTAYALTNRFENIYGVAIDTCEIVFSARQSQGEERVKTFAGIAVSKDGRELYTHQSPTRLLADRYEVQGARLAVYDTNGGLDSLPLRTLPAPRQITIMATGEDGTVYLGGRDIFAMDPSSGEVRVALPSQSADIALESQRDVLSVWPLGSVNNEMVRMYSAARFQDESQDMETADWIWGYERIDLATGAAEDRVFGPLEVVLFSGMARPDHPEQFFGVLTQLKKFDVAAAQEVASVDLEHSYYCINFATDGSELYLAGTFNDIAIYDPDTLERLGNIQLPGGDMSLANSQVFRRVL
ncbi:quinohemoprotein amine dehydrogenase subunit beta [Haliea sp. E1-2-M8]|uniref:quinohemoprotein amine dehydrogenase subunit beta n=1 Tax=Haliea sp. E1-2-M8 TaxID=3064706 RepID=UPI002721F787|nr:quinohemoprotein amine dehydrogenase subunit beta [Haliea sp. E1-2-M8]MDO8862658.1 quinohemoprotein amine dehydrogenase subunit beta [Haliea sp. E1-2-M8]